MPNSLQPFNRGRGRSKQNILQKNLRVKEINKVIIISLVIDHNSKSYEKHIQNSRRNYNWDHVPNPNGDGPIKNNKM